MSYYYVYHDDAIQLTPSIAGFNIPVTCWDANIAVNIKIYQAGFVSKSGRPYQAASHFGIIGVNVHPDRLNWSFQPRRNVLFCCSVLDPLPINTFSISLKLSTDIICSVLSWYYGD